MLNKKTWTLQLAIRAWRKAGTYPLRSSSIGTTETGREQSRHAPNDPLDHLTLIWDTCAALEWSSQLAIFSNMRWLSKWLRPELAPPLFVWSCLDITVVQALLVQSFRPEFAWRPFCDASSAHRSRIPSVDKADLGEPIYFDSVSFFGAEPSLTDVHTDACILLLSLGIGFSLSSLPRPVMDSFCRASHDEATRVYDLEPRSFIPSLFRTHKTWANHQTSSAKLIASKREATFCRLELVASVYHDCAPVFTWLVLSSGFNSSWIRLISTRTAYQTHLSSALEQVTAVSHTSSILELTFVQQRLDLYSHLWFPKAFDALYGSYKVSNGQSFISRTNIIQITRHTLTLWILIAMQSCFQTSVRKPWLLDLR